MAASRVAFRQAVDHYQSFVVPHCAPADVAAYVAARAGRDRAFVRSLRGTMLKADYDKAVADRAKRDRNTIYECFGPPPPPGTVPAEPTPEEAERKRQADLADHFKAGDEQFDIMVRLRDQIVHAAGG